MISQVLCSKNERCHSFSCGYSGVEAPERSAMHAGKVRINPHIWYTNYHMAVYCITSPKPLHYSLNSNCQQTGFPPANHECIYPSINDPDPVFRSSPGPTVYGVKVVH